MATGPSGKRSPDTSSLMVGVNEGMRSSSPAAMARPLVVASLAASATEYAKPAAPARWHNCAHDELAGRHAHNARSDPAVRRPCGADRDGHMIVSNRTVLVA